MTVSVTNLDELRTELHWRAMRLMAEKSGLDPEEVVAQRRHLQNMVPGRDLRLSIPKARYVIERGTGRGYTGR